MDIDIDLPVDFEPLDYFNVVRASMVENGELKKHPAGVYFQNIPKDSETGLAAIPYKETEDIGFTKIDFLHLSMLKKFNSKRQIKEFLKREPEWSLLEDPKVVKHLFHIGKHFDVISRINPRSVIEIADVLALIRPGKMKLMDDYLQDKAGTRPELYTKRINSDMRKAHAVSYALLIVLQLHLIGEALNGDH
jgi:hypothetical protein